MSVRLSEDDRSVFTSSFDANEKIYQLRLQGWRNWCFLTGQRQTKDGLKAVIFPVWQLEDSQRPIVRRSRTKRNGHRNMDWFRQWQGLDLPMANLQSKRRRGRPRKLLAPAQQSSLTRDSSKRPRKLSEFVLPAGWTKEVITSKNGEYSWREDTLYIEEATGQQFRIHRKTQSFYGSVQPFDLLRSSGCMDGSCHSQDHSSNHGRGSGLT